MTRVNIDALPCNYLFGIGRSRTTDRLGDPELQTDRRNGRTESFWAFHNRLDKNVEIGYYLGKSSRLGAGIVALLLAWLNLTESSGRYYKARTATAMLGDFNRTDSRQFACLRNAGIGPLYASRRGTEAAKTHTGSVAPRVRCNGSAI